MYIYMYIYIYIYIYRYQQCVTIHRVPKCMSCHESIVMMTRRAHGFHDNIIYGIYIKYINYIDIYLYLYRL